jgi:branched-chain amino acid aminotransferase
MGLVGEGRKRFDRDAELYIRPMYWPEDAAAGAVRPDPETTRWCLTLYVVPLPKPTGTAITLSPFRRPTRESAPVDAKAGCLYPNNARALIEARSRGFDNCLMCDMLGNVAELGTANIFMAKDGVVFTPAANGTFLSGITRGRVIALLREAGVTVVEAVLRYSDFQSADEFSTGNFTSTRLSFGSTTAIRSRARSTAEPGAVGSSRTRGREAYESGPRTVSSVVIERPRMS